VYEGYVAKLHVATWLRQIPPTLAFSNADTLDSAHNAAHFPTDGL
jgi:hypothetical protein